MRVAVSGGGTAGHISPALATVDALSALASRHNEPLDILYIGQARSMEAKIVMAAGWPFAPIPAGKFRRNQGASSRLAKLVDLSTLGPNLRDLFRVMAGTVAALRALRQFKPDVVFLKGGFVCLPVGIAASILRLPIVIHESDLTPGLTNRIVARWAQKIAVGFPEKNYRAFWPMEKLVYTGSPVRPELLKAHRLEGLAHFHLEDSLPVVLVTGGSQGAAQINDAVVGALPQLLEFCQVIHQTGEGELARVEFALNRTSNLTHRSRYIPVAFLTSDMGLALAAADIVVGRAGVGTITDAALLGKPTVLIPNTNMAGHQVANAKLLARNGAARVISGDNVTSQRLVGEIKYLLGNPEEGERLSRAIRQYAKVDAADELAKLVWASAERGGE